jgi:hypothetical protein
MPFWKNISETTYERPGDGVTASWMAAPGDVVECDTNPAPGSFEESETAPESPPAEPVQPEE